MTGRDLGKAHLELAYAAGLLDGGATIGLYKIGSRTSAVIRLSCANQEPLWFLRDLFGGGVQMRWRPNVFSAGDEATSPAYIWFAMQLKTLRACLLLLPYMRTPAKRERMEAIILYYRTHEGRGTQMNRFRRDVDKVFEEVALACEVTQCSESSA